MTTRRVFIQTASAALTVNALRPSIGAAVAPASADRNLRLGLISAATYGYMGAPRQSGSNHGTAFATACNGFDEEKRKAFEGTFVAARKRLPNARITKVWDPVDKYAQHLAAACNIPEVCRTADECSTGVDAVILVDDGTGEQWRYARTPLQKGVPTFCDKPLAMTAKQAKEIAALARKTGTPFMSASSLRFVPDIVALAREAPALGDIHLATVTGSNDLVYYGIHGLEMAYAVLGRGAVSCVNVGQTGRNVVRVRFASGRDVVLLVSDREWMRTAYQISLFGTKGSRTVVPDLSDLYWYLLNAFCDLVRTGREVVPIEEEVEVIAVLDAARRSLVEKREVTLAEVLS